MGFPARCPLCGGREVGRVGTTQFYCWDCCIEFAMSRRGPRLFRLEPDGTLVTIPLGEAQPGAGGQHQAAGGVAIDGGIAWRGEVGG